MAKIDRLALAKIDRIALEKRRKDAVIAALETSNLNSESLRLRLTNTWRVILKNNNPESKMEQAIFASFARWPESVSSMLKKAVIADQDHLSPWWTGRLS